MDLYVVVNNIYQTYTDVLPTYAEVMMIKTIRYQQGHLFYHIKNILLYKCIIYNYKTIYEITKQGLKTNFGN